MDVPGQPALDHGPSPPSINLPTPSTAMAIGAHPDDVEFGCGATLAKWAASGCVVHHLVLTDGSKGSWNPKIDTGQLITRRQGEQREAAGALGATGEVVFLGAIDGELEATLANRAMVASWIRKWRPDVVIGHDPWRRYRLHPDHRAAGYLAAEGIVAARDPHFFPDQKIAPHRPEHLLLFEADTIDHVEDVSSFVEQKLRALECHQSQFETTMGTATAEGLAPFRLAVRSRLAEHGFAFALAAAESYKRISDL
jgi:LmbE family N-acetylglucosaminyl deacetylase